MSLADYEELKIEIISWSHRDDLDLKIDDFIDMAEAEMYANDDEPLEIRESETRGAFSTSTSDRFVALPTGYQSMRKIRIQIAGGESIELEYRTPSQLNIISSTGMPYFFTVADQIEMDRISDQAYTGEIQYFQEITPLSSSNTTNDILTNFPSIYLFGSLWALKLYTDQPNESALFYQKFISSIRGANKKDKKGRYGPAPVMKVDSCTP